MYLTVSRLLVNDAVGLRELANNGRHMGTGRFENLEFMGCQSNLASLCVKTIGLLPHLTETLHLGVSMELSGLRSREVLCVSAIR